jgi:hypothetical protein
MTGRVPMSTPAEQARVYREAGLRVMPVCMRRKAPDVPKGFYGKAHSDATAEPEDFEPRHQVGILCGCVEHRDDVELLGLDRDGAAEWSDLEDALGIELPPTLSSKGDRHRFYWLPAGHGLKQRNGAIKVEGGQIDVRPHAGGYFREPWEWDAPFDIDAVTPLGAEHVDAAAVEALRALIGTAADDADADDGRERTFDGATWAPDISAIANQVAPAGVNGEGRHEIVRALGGYLARRGYTPKAVAEAVREHFPSDKPHARARQAWQAARRAWLGLPVPGWTELVARFGDVVVRRLEADVRDPAEPEHFAGGVWSAWWWRYWPRLVARHKYTTPVCAVLRALPAWCRAHVEACQEQFRTPIELNLTLALGAVSSAVQGRVVVRLQRDWSEQTALYLAAVADVGEGKSPSLRRATGPITEWENETIEAGREDLAAKKLRRDDLRARKTGFENVRKKAYGIDFKDTVPLEGEMIQIVAELDKPEPVAFRYLVENATSEKLIDLLAVHGRLAFITGEGDVVFKTLAGKYNDKGQADVTCWLKAYDGEAVRVDRIKREAAELQHPHVTLSAVLTIQPSVFSEAARNPEFSGQGLVQRFGWVKVPLGGVRYARGEEPAHIPADVEQLYTDRLRAMLQLGTPMNDKPAEAIEVQLSPDAWAAAVRLRDELEPRFRGRGGDLFDMRGWVNKHVGRVARIAGILWAADGAEGSITVAQFERAAVIGDWLLRCTVDALRSCRAGVAETLDDRLMSLVAQGMRTRRSLTQKLSKPQRLDFEATLAKLIDAGTLVETPEGFAVASAA